MELTSTDVWRKATAFPMHKQLDVVVAQAIKGRVWEQLEMLLYKQQQLLKGSNLESHDLQI